MAQSPRGTNITLSPLTLGTAQLGLRYGIANQTGKPDWTEAERMLQTAWKNGITCYDTARMYGDSEEVLGRFFENRELPVFNTPVFITKIKLFPDTEPAQVRPLIKEQVAESLKQLRVRQVSILMLHSVLVSERCWQEAMLAFEECVHEGWVEAIGLSAGADRESLSRLVRYSDHPLIQYVQLPVNLADGRPVFQETLAYLRQRGIQVFARSVYLQGLLLMAEERIPPDLAEIRPLLRILRSYAEETGISVPQLLVSYVRDLEGVHSLVIGAESADQVERNLAFMDGPSLDTSFRRKIVEAAESLSEHVLDPASWNQQAVFTKKS